MQWGAITIRASWAKERGQYGLLTDPKASSLLSRRRDGPQKTRGRGHEDNRMHMRTFPGSQKSDQRAFRIVQTSIRTYASISRATTGASAAPESMACPEFSGGAASAHAGAPQQPQRNMDKLSYHALRSCSRRIQASAGVKRPARAPLRWRCRPRRRPGRLEPGRPRAPGDQALRRQ